jgi:uncharacterized protein
MNDIVRTAPGATEVAAYLRQHPRFLSQFPDLALGLVVPREDGSTTSLASYQLEVLRDKNRELNRRLHELYANAAENERLAVRTHQLALALMRADSAAATLQTMVACLREDFHGERIRLVLHREVAALEPVDWLQTIPRDAPALAPFGQFLATGEPLCGRLQADKLALLFGADAAAVESAALLALDGRGLLAIGSADPQRFFPGMGTLFLRLMGETLVTALARHDGSA